MNSKRKAMWYLVAQVDPDGKVTLGWTTEAYKHLHEAPD